MIYVIGISRRILSPVSRRFFADYVPNVKFSNRFTVLTIVQQSTSFLKHVENKVKPLSVKTKRQKMKIHYLRVVIRGKFDHAPIKSGHSVRNHKYF
jgi:MFS-type transporter involved in bile tolerance (Atg22 family)